MLDTSAPTHELLDRVEVTSATDLLVKYDNTSAALAALTVKYGSAVFDCTVPEQDKQARSARRELVGLRTTLEAKRVELKAPYLEIGKEIDQKAAFLKTAIAALELPIDAQIKIEEDRKEHLRIEAARVEFERVAAIKAKIAVISRVRIDALRMSAPQIEAALSAEFDFGDFAEFESEARAAYEETCQALHSMLALRMQQEDEQAQLQKDRAALDEKVARLDAEFAAKSAAMEADKAELARQLAALKNKADADIAEVGEIEKARLCAAAPLMLKALKMVALLSWLTGEERTQIHEAIFAAEGGAK